MKKEEVLFSADWHLEHTNILKYTNRPHKDVYSMSNEIVDTFAKAMKPGMRLYILGDVIFHIRNLKDYMDRIPGEKFLIKGNHDPKQIPPGIFNGIWDVKTIDVDGQSIFMSHFAHRTWNKAHHGAIHLYGHTHNSMPDYYRSMDVGVDCNNYKPFTYDDVWKRLKDQPFLPHH